MSDVDRYGVFGHPVGHSLSPFIHGMFARETGQHMTYRPYDVLPEELAPRVRAFFAEGGSGLNITLPHEQYPTPYASPDLCFRFHYFANRKLHFLLRARALVDTLLAGGSSKIEPQ